MKKDIASFNLSFLRLLLVCCFLLSAASLQGDDAEGIQYRHEAREEPRPVHVHILTIDLYDPALELHVEAALPPEEGEGIAVLTDPFALVERGEFDAAINANPWSMVDGSRNYLEGRSAYRLGWIASEGETVSDPRGLANFWVDEDGEAFIGNVSSPVDDAVLGIEGFHRIVENGEILPEEGTSEAPRTALGLDEEKRLLTLVVVDGRMKSYSEGLSHRELAKLMRELGGRDAINLDGGGSSIMIKRTNDEFERKNRGIYGYRRPLPVLFGVRKTE